MVGGEAKRWARDLVRAGRDAAETASPGGARRRAAPAPGRSWSRSRWPTGLWDPVQQYAMIDNALRSQRVAPGRAPYRLADLWARFNRVAHGNPDAAFPEPVDAEQLATPSPSNRPLAFPYNKWHSTQWTVNQSAALLLCSAEAAAVLAVPTDRWVFPLAAVQSSHAVSLLRRTEPHTWPAMGVLGRAVAGRIGRPLPEAEVLEVYSCFPAAVRVQQRELGLAPDAAPTVTGGMAFAGGPFNNFVLQAMVEVVARVRADPGALGAGHLGQRAPDQPGIGAWSARPDGRPPWWPTWPARARRRPASSDVLETLEEYAGDATVVTYTVTFDGMDPVRTVALCRTADGTRCVAMSDDAALAAPAPSTSWSGPGCGWSGVGSTSV